MQPPCRTRRTFLGEAALLAVRALNGPGAPTLLPAIHRVVKAVRPKLVGPEAALYGYWMEWRTCNQLGWPVSMGDALRLMGQGAATSLHSSAPALLHTLRTHHSMDAAPYLNQAGATYPGGMYQLHAALHLSGQPDKYLEVGEVTIFVEGAGETPSRPAQPTRCMKAPGRHPCTPSCARCSPESPPGAPHSRQRPTRLGAGPSRTCLPPSLGPGTPTTGGRSSGSGSGLWALGGRRGLPGGAAQGGPP